MRQSKEIRSGPKTPFQHLFLAPIQVALDLGVLFCAIALAYLLRFDFALPPNHFHMFLLQFPMVVLIQFVALTMTGARATIWRYTDLAHVKPFLNGALGSSLLFLILRVFLPSHYADWRVSVSIIMMDTLLAFGGVFAMRLLRHAAYDYQQKRRQLKKSIGNGHHKRDVLLLGAGRAGLLAANEIEARGDTDLAIKGFIDDDRLKIGRTVMLGHKVLGTTQD